MLWHCFWHPLRCGCLCALPERQERLLGSWFGGKLGKFLSSVKFTSKLCIEAATWHRSVRHSATTSAVDCDCIESGGCATGDIAVTTYQSEKSLVGMLCATTKTLISWSKALQGKRENSPLKGSMELLSEGGVCN